jgi:hypothetical protein
LKNLTKGELDWFDFETRVRKVVHDLLLPVFAKQNDSKED